MMIQSLTKMRLLLFLKFYAIIIGIEDYDDEINDLNEPVKMQMTYLVINRKIHIQ